MSLAQATLAGGSPGGNDMEAVGGGGEVRRKRGVSQNRADSVFFATHRMALVSGRGFTSRDNVDNPAVTVINETLAERLWPGQSPIGQQVSTHGRELEVVGIVSDGRYSFRNGQPSGYAFLPLGQRFASRLTFHVRSGSAPGRLIRSIRDEVRRVDPDVAVEDATTLTLPAGRLLAPQRAITALLTLAGLIAVVLAGIGAYGVMAFEVGQRSRDIGIRMALGGPSLTVVRGVIARGVVPASGGAAIGLVLATGASVFLQRILYGLKAVDRSSFLLL